MLWLPDADGNLAWRDHDSYVVMQDEWPARPYPTARIRRVVALVNGVPGAETVNGVIGSGTTNLATQLAAELRIPLFSGDVAGSADVLWALLADSPVGGVVESRFRPDDARYVAEGLQRCGLDPAAVPEVWCFSAQVEAPARPVGLGPTLAVDVGQGVARADVVRIALQVGAWLAPCPRLSDESSGQR